MKILSDKSYLENPLFEYVLWLRTKFKYQRKYKDSYLRIGYMSILNNVTFGKYSWTSRRVVLNNVVLGDFSYVSDNSVVLEANIGKFCSIGPNVRVAPGKHPTSTFVSSHPALFSNPPYCLKNFFDKDYHNPNRQVTIGNDVWICANVVISDGVTIGDGAIIAANSVVSSNVKPYTIVGGVPAKFIRNRFEENEILFLLKIKWWDKSFEWIKANSVLFLNIKEFIKLNPDD